MSPKLSIFLLTLLCVVLGLMRSDCSMAPGGKPVVHVSFWNGFTGPDGRIMLRLVRRFNEANPDVEVSMQRMAWGTYYNKLMVAAVNKRGPEVFVLQSHFLARMNRAGFLDKVTDLYGGKTGIPADDFDPTVINQVRYGKDYIGLPLDIWPFGLYCNATMLKKAGIVDANGNARPPRNQREFLSAAHAMQHVGGEDVWGYALTDWGVNFMTLITQFDGRLLTPDGKADLDNPGNVEALNFMASLKKGKSLIPPPDNQLGWTGFRQQKVGMVIDGIYMLGDLQRLEDFKYLGVPVPVIGKHEGTLAGSHMLCVKAGLPPREREASLRFLRFLSENSIDWSKAGQVPARRSVRALPEFAKLTVQYNFAKQIPYLTYQPRSPIISELDREVGFAVEHVIRGSMTTEQALKIASKNVQEFIDRDAAEQKRQEVRP